MARLILILLLLCPALAQKVPCKTDLVPGGELAVNTPSDVLVDARGRIFLLYGREGGAELLDAAGRSLMKLETGETEPRATRFRVHALWTGSGAPPSLLASQDGPEGAVWVLTPSDDNLKATRLRGAPEPISDQAVLAREGDRYYVLDNATNPPRLWIFSTSGAFVARGSCPGLARVRKMALDRNHNLYALVDAGLVVYNRLGSKRYTLPGARAFSVNREDRLVAAGGEWLRKFDLSGNLLAEGRPPQGATQPEAMSLTADGSMFVYYAGGLLARFDARAELEDESNFNPGSSPAGYGLDSQGRLFTWDNGAEQLIMRAPSGKVINRAGYVPGGFSPDKLVNPTDATLAPDGKIWVGEAGGCRLHRYHPERGWLEPIAVGIRGGAARAEPLQIKSDHRGELLMLVAPAGRRGNLFIQRRDSSGKLLGQKDLGPIGPGAVVKLAVQPSGESYLYRSDTSPRPSLERFDSRGNRIGFVGGKDPNFTLSKGVATGIFLKPEEDLVAYKGGLIIPTGGQLIYLDSELKIYKVLALSHHRSATGARVTLDFGGACLADGVLYVTDMSNQCVHKIMLR
ncbi:hypothetical protein DYH09_05695 [bacterium CPR1]|nr:hypothetical protein [bacterium CPR1]